MILTGQEALVEREEALAISLRLHGDEHPTVASCMCNLAAIYFQQERNEEYIVLYKKALKIRRTTLGPDHEEVAQAQKNIGFAYYRIGKITEPPAAENWFKMAMRKTKKAQRIYTECFGVDHVGVADSIMVICSCMTHMQHTRDTSVDRRKQLIEEAHRVYVKLENTGSLARLAAQLVSKGIFLVWI